MGPEITIQPDLLNESCDVITAWTDGDTGGCHSEVSPAGQFLFEAHAPLAGNGVAERYRTIASPPDQFTIEVKTYFDDIGSMEWNGHAEIRYMTETWKFKAAFCGNSTGNGGLFIFKTSAASVEVGTNLPSFDWQTWRFQVDKTTFESKATVEVFLDNVSQGIFDCDYEVAGTNGEIAFAQNVDDSPDGTHYSHVDYIKVGTGLGEFATFIPRIMIF